MIIESKQEGYLLQDMLHSLSCYETMIEYEEMEDEVARQLHLLSLLPDKVNLLSGCICN